MAEWLKAHAWKACIRATVSWVRIPLPPPDGTDLIDSFQVYGCQPVPVRVLGGRMGGLMGHGAHLFPNTQNCQRVTKHSTAQGAPYRPPRRPHKGRLQPGHLVRPAHGGRTKVPFAA